MAKKEIIEVEDEIIDVLHTALTVEFTSYINTPQRKLPYAIKLGPYNFYFKVKIQERDEHGLRRWRYVFRQK